MIAPELACVTRALIRPVGAAAAGLGRASVTPLQHHQPPAVARLETVGSEQSGWSRVAGILRHLAGPLLSGISGMTGLGSNMGVIEPGVLAFEKMNMVSRAPQGCATDRQCAMACAD